MYPKAEEIGRLAALARQEGTLQAEVILRAIREHVPRLEGGRGRALFGTAEGPEGSIADVAAVELLEGFGG